MSHKDWRWLFSLGMKQFCRSHVFWTDWWPCRLCRGPGRSHPNWVNSGRVLNFTESLFPFSLKWEHEYISCTYPVVLGFLGGSVGKELVCNAGDCFSPWVEKISRRREWQPTPVFLPGESHGQVSLVGSQRVRPDWSDLARIHCFKEALTLLTLFIIMADKASEWINSLFSPLAPGWEKHTSMPSLEGTGHWYTFFHQVDCFSAPLHTAQGQIFWYVCGYQSKDQGAVQVRNWATLPPHSAIALLRSFLSGCFWLCSVFLKISFSFNTGMLLCWVFMGTLVIAPHGIACVCLGDKFFYMCWGKLLFLQTLITDSYVLVSHLPAVLPRALL